MQKKSSKIIFQKKHAQKAEMQKKKNTKKGVVFL